MRGVASQAACIITIIIIVSFRVRRTSCLAPLPSTIPVNLFILFFRSHLLSAFIRLFWICFWFLVLFLVSCFQIRCGEPWALCNCVTTEAVEAAVATPVRYRHRNVVVDLRRCSFRFCLDLIAMAELRAHTDFKCSVRHLLPNNDRNIVHVSEFHICICLRERSIPHRMTWMRVREHMKLWSQNQKAISNEKWLASSEMSRCDVIEVFENFNIIGFVWLYEWAQLHD